MMLASWLALCLAAGAAGRADPHRFAGSRPNVVVLFVDDFGWGDVGMNNPDVKETPTLDALAAAGIHFTDMHAFPLCTPSRAQLLTGRVGARTGVTVNFDTTSVGGLPQTELTIAELLKTAGYDTAFGGKWHLGTHPGFHPSFRGFDRVLSVPYSVDMGCLGPAGGPFYNTGKPDVCPTGPNTAPLADGPPALPLYNVSTPHCNGNATRAGCNAAIVQQPVVENDLAAAYGSFMAGFIQEHAAGGPRAGVPFYAHMAFSHTHVPLFHDPRFTNASTRRTVFADTTLELDATVGVIVGALRDAGLDNDTLVLATADNGPWAVKCELAGTAGPFRGAYQAQLGGGSPFKDTTWEGGQREFGLAHWPGRVAPRISNATVSTLDFLPTVLALAGVPLPADRHYDGVDLAPVLFGGAASVRDFLFMGDTTSRAGEGRGGGSGRGRGRDRPLT